MQYNCITLETGEKKKPLMQNGGGGGGGHRMHIAWECPLILGISKVQLHPLVGLHHASSWDLHNRIFFQTKVILQAFSLITIVKERALSLPHACSAADLYWHLGA